MFSFLNLEIHHEDVWIIITGRQILLWRDALQVHSRLTENEPRYRGQVTDIQDKDHEPQRFKDVCDFQNLPYFIIINVNVICHFKIVVHDVLNLFVIRFFHEVHNFIDVEYVEAFDNSEHL